MLRRGLAKNSIPKVAMPQALRGATRSLFPRRGMETLTLTLRRSANSVLATLRASPEEKQKYLCQA